MAHDHTPREPEIATPDAPAPVQRHDGWTPRRQAAFLRRLCETQSVSLAARSVGMGRQSAYKLRARLADQPFGAGWRLALRNARNSVLDAAIERAVHGVEVPHYWKGELIGTSRRFDERLTTALLGAGMLQRSDPAGGPAECEFVARGLPRLLERIATGPAHWRDVAEERAFAWAGMADEAIALDEDEEPAEAEGETRWPHAG